MRLENYCMMSEDDLFLLLGELPNAVTGRDYIYIDNHAPVLAVCHADLAGSIVNDVDFAEAYTNRGRHFATSPALDDRLGIWLLIEYISKRVDVDILITTGEESGSSTAFEFAEDMLGLREWNWIVEFDRRGADYVTYEFENSRFDKKMARCGFIKGIGSFSDICLLEDFGVMAFNVGIGYHHEHSRQCYADLDETMDQVARFMKFYRKYSGVRFENHGMTRLFGDDSSFSAYDMEDRYEGYRPDDWWFDPYNNSDDHAKGHNKPKQSLVRYTNGKRRLHV